MEPLHCLLLRLVHFELANWHFVLVALAARPHLVSNVDIGATSREALLQQYLVVTDLKLVSCKASLVVLEISLLAIVSVPLPVAVGAFRASIFVAMATRKKNRCPIEGWLWCLWLLLNLLFRFLRLIFCLLLVSLRGLLLAFR